MQRATEKEVVVLSDREVPVSGLAEERRVLEVWRLGDSIGV